MWLKIWLISCDITQQVSWAKWKQIFDCVTESRQTTYFLYKPEFLKTVYWNVDQQNHCLKRYCISFLWKKGTRSEKRVYSTIGCYNLVRMITKIRIILHNFFTPLWPSFEVIKFNLIYHQLKKFTWPLSSPVPTKFFKIDYSFSSALPKMLIC